MAIQHRRGNFADFDPYKMRPGEWAFPLDRGEGYYCISPGDVRRVATKEEIIEILETNQQAYDGLQQLLTELEDETVLTGILADISQLLDDVAINKSKIATNTQDIVNLDTRVSTNTQDIADLDATVNTHLADIVQTAEVNSSTKYPSAAVTYNLQQQLNNYSIQNISSAVTTIGITSPVVTAFKFGKLAIVTVTGTATNNISAYAAIAKLNGYTANSTQFFLNTNNKSCVVYNNSSNISCREALSAQEDISFTAIILLN